jgi:hypothetical protein
MIKDEFIKIGMGIFNDDRKKLKNHILKARNPYEYSFVTDVSKKPNSYEMEVLDMKFNKKSIDSLIDLLPDDEVRKLLQMPPDVAKEAMEEYLNKNEASFFGYIMRNLY